MEDFHIQQSSSTKPSRFTAWTTLFALTLRRQFFTRQTVVMLVLLGFAVLVAYVWSIPRERTTEQLAKQIILPLYIGFLLPIICLGYAAGAIAGERSDDNLVYLLITPLPRPMSYLAKYGAVLLLTLGLTMGGLAALCTAPGKFGFEVFLIFWPAAACATTAYVGLFLLFSATFRRATFVALAYAMMIETLVGNIPGTIKRMTVSFYTKCWLFDSGAVLEIAPTGTRRELFIPIPGDSAQFTLVLLSATFVLVGMFLFTTKEYD